ncbi:conjugative transfer protein [Legionella busanensis]|uniref:Conjugative transfer protein n=1 Tax=Legionella busanensis TaxID=190655 RepID=A0A378KIT9_9GAMM|nr:conjugal transfer protein [Legionella busanensis]STX81714.1 conjugative transfer protein [Legionella busanensis]
MIKHALFVLIPILCGLMAGCGTMNSDFSCHATAGDSCLTIEQVDAMTRFADEVTPPLSKRTQRYQEFNHVNHLGKIIKQPNGQSLWVAQQVEEQSWA